MTLMVCVAAGSAAAQEDQIDRVRDAAVALDEIMAASDKSIPTSILQRAEAIVVIPSAKKAGLGFGGQYGRGVMSARDANGVWSSPAFLRLDGGSVGFQIGGSSTDIVLVVMNRRGLDNLMRNQFEVGGEAGATAGPVGRDAAASTDIQMRAQILSYSRSRGLFAGVSLKGASIRQDLDSNEKFYGSRFITRDILIERKATQPRSAEAVAQWQAALQKHAAR